MTKSTDRLALVTELLAVTNRDDDMLEKWMKAVAELSTPGLESEVMDAVLYASSDSIHAPFFRQVIACWTAGLSVDVQLRLLERGAWKVLRRPDAAPEVHAEALRMAETTWDARWELSVYTDLPVDVQLAWAALDDADIQWALAGNRHLDPRTQVALAQCGDMDVLERLCGNEALTAEAMRILVKTGVAQILTYRVDLPVDVQLELVAQGACIQVAGVVSDERVVAALRESTQWDTDLFTELCTSSRLPEEVLWVLLHEGGEAAARGITRNPRVTLEMFWALLGGMAEAGEAVATSPFAPLDVLHEVVRVDFEGLKNDAYNHPNFRWALWMNYDDANWYAYDYVTTVRDEHGIDVETWNALASSWEGSVGDLVQACLLTKR